MIFMSSLCASQEHLLYPLIQKQLEKIFFVHQIDILLLGAGLCWFPCEPCAWFPCAGLS